MPTKKYAKVKTEIGERLKKAIGLFNYKNINEFIVDKNLKKSTIYGILNQGKSPSTETLSVLKDIGINPTFIITGDNEPLLPSARKRIDQGTIQKTSGITKETREFIQHLEGLVMQLNVKDDQSVVKFDENEMTEEIMKLLAKLNNETLEKIILMARAIQLGKRSKSVDSPAESI